MKVTPPTSYVRSSSVIRGEEALAGVFHGVYKRADSRYQRAKRHEEKAARL